MTGEGSGPAPRWLLLATLIAAAALALASIQPSGARAARGMELGIFDPEFNIANVPLRTTALDRATEAHAGFVIIYVVWRGTAPNSPPPGFNASDPADPAYDWSVADGAVRDAQARGLKVVLAITRAPAFAEGSGRPSVDQAPEGTWKPDPVALGEFTRAIATRYSGTFGGLPAVRHWQLWAEPNLAVNLGPQFEGNTPVGYEVYRPMLNAFYNNLKAVSPQNQVIMGGTAPYGGLTPVGGQVYQRMQPVAFWRGLMCFSAGKKKKAKKRKKGRAATAAAARQRKLIPLPCPNPPRFDIAAHHPINVGAPTRAAVNVDDASTPDLSKLKRILRAAARSGRVVPGGPKPLWATELWWNSNPPKAGALPLGRQARYLEQAFYILWKQGVQASFWFEVRDAEGSTQATGGLPVPTTGLFLRDGTPKPALRAYQFPFVTERLSKTRVRAWGEAPGAGRVKIQIGRGKRFRTIKTLGAGSNRVFVGVLGLRGKARLRAKQGSATSLVWRQG
jgi:hypothetical protein